MLSIICKLKKKNYFRHIKTCVDKNTENISNLWDEAKSVFRWSCIYLNVHIRNAERHKINNKLNVDLKKLYKLK